MTDDTITTPALRSGLNQARRMAFSRRRIIMPMALFFAVAALYLGLVVAILAAPMPLAALFSPLCGAVIGVLFIIGHDACHGNLTPSHWLNHIIGRLAFLPSLHSFTAWDLAHNRMHHTYNNLRGWDAVWEPMSPEDYRLRGSFARAAYRFYRSPAGVPFYYGIMLWAPMHSGLAAYIRRRLSPAYFLDLVLVLVFLTLQAVAVTKAGAFFGHNIAASLTLGVLVPFLTWNGLMSAIIFLHHTHPALRWYADLDAWKADRGAIASTAHVRFPWPIGDMILFIMEHSAHHAAPGVPFYNLAAMQRAMAEHQDMLSWKFSFRALVRICGRCQIYDYTLGRWVTFQEAEAGAPAVR